MWILILDSNVWIHAVTIDGGRSDTLVERIISGDESGAISAYMFEEVRRNIDSDHSVPRRQRDAALEEFAAVVSQCPAIACATQQEIESVSLSDERGRAYYRLIGAMGDIQTKDAPVLTLAYDYVDSQPTVLTDDRSFAKLSPSEYGIPEISIEHVPLEWVPAGQTID